MRPYITYRYVEIPQEGWEWHEHVRALSGFAAISHHQPLIITPYQLDPGCCPVLVQVQRSSQALGCTCNIHLLATPFHHSFENNIDRDRPSNSSMVGHAPLDLLLGSISRL